MNFANSAAESISRPDSIWDARRDPLPRAICARVFTNADYFFGPFPDRLAGVLFSEFWSAAILACRF